MKATPAYERSSPRYGRCAFINLTAGVSARAGWATVTIRVRGVSTIALSRRAVIRFSRSWFGDVLVDAGLL